MNRPRFARRVLHKRRLFRFGLVLSIAVPAIIIWHHGVPPAAIEILIRIGIAGAVLLPFLLIVLELRLSRLDRQRQHQEIKDELSGLRLAVVVGLPRIRTSLQVRSPEPGYEKSSNASGTTIAAAPQGPTREATHVEEDQETTVLGRTQVSPGQQRGGKQ